GGGARCWRRAPGPRPGGRARRAAPPRAGRRRRRRGGADGRSGGRGRATARAAASDAAAPCDPRSAGRSDRRRPSSAAPRRDRGRPPAPGVRARSAAPRSCAAGGRPAGSGHAARPRTRGARSRCRAGGRPRRSRGWDGWTTAGTWPARRSGARRRGCAGRPGWEAGRRRAGAGPGAAWVRILRPRLGRREPGWEGMGSVAQPSAHDTARPARPDPLANAVPGQELVYGLLQRAWSAWARRRYADELARVETFCLFIGYPRSGHSIVGALLNAHRHAVIAHELDAPRLVLAGCSREVLFSRILARAAWFNLRGNASNYDYQVPNRWQGRFEALLVVISTYLVATSIFLYLPLIPDLAILRDRLATRGGGWR